MASVNKLSIRGVRSFSPDDDEQVLEFYFPCTIIVGANGCGKTTIIEALKFAVCGAMPPGNKSGQAFVHDPRSIGQSVVKANIKLRFTNRAGASMVVARSMEVQQKKTTLTFKQLDGVLRIIDPDGNRQSMSHKCSELDRQIPNLLGVSKSILEHVVFCHQEDASWPLQEGAILKKRFDDIFDSSRYTKALEVFAKLKKEYTATVKDLKIDVAALKSHKHAALGFQQEIQQHSDIMEDVEDQIVECQQALKETEQELLRVSSIAEEYDELVNDAAQKKDQVAHLEVVVSEKLGMLQEDLTSQTTRALKEMVRDFDAQMGNQVEQRKELEEDMQALKQDLAKLQNDKTALQAELGRLQEKKESNDRHLTLRYEKMVELGNTFGLGDALTPFTQSQPSQQQTTQNSSFLDLSMTGDGRSQLQTPILDIPQQDMSEYFRAVTKKEEQMKETLSNHKQKYQSQEDQIGDQLAELKGKLKSIETSRAKLTRDSNDARKKIRELSSADSADSSHRIRKTDVEEAVRNAQKYAADRETANSDPRRNQIPIEIRSHEDKIDRLNREIQDDQDSLKLLRDSAEAQNSIHLLQEQCNKELGVLKEDLDEQSFNFQKFNISKPGVLPGSQGGDESGEELTNVFEKLLDDVQSKKESINLELSKANDEVTKLQLAVSEASALLSQDRRSLTSKQARMEQLDGAGGSISKIRGVMEELQKYENGNNIATPAAIDISRPKEFLNYLSSRLEEEEAQSLEGVQPDVVRKIILRLKKQAKGGNSVACPCCTRDFTAPEEIETFQNQMQLLGGDKTPLLKGDETSQSARSLYQEWRNVVADNMNGVLDYRRLANEVNELETRMMELESAHKTKTEQFEKEKGAASDFEMEEKDIHEILDATKRYIDAAKRISQKRIEVNQKQIDLSMSHSDFGGRDLRTVERELQDRLDKKDQHSNMVSRLNKEMSTLNDRINKVSQLAERMEKLARDKEKRYADAQRQTEEKKALNEQIAKFTAEYEKLQEEIGPLNVKIRSKESEKSRMRNLAAEEEEKLTETLNSFNGAVQDLKVVTSQIDRYNDSNSESELNKISQRESELVEKEKTKLSQIEALQPGLDRLVKAVDDQERHKKNLKDNIDLISKRQNIENLEKEITDLEEAASNVEGHETCVNDLNSLESRKEQSMSSIARLEGRRGEILESIRGLKRKLSTDEYRTVEEDYRVAMIKQETTQAAVRDIDKYHGALDRALLRFHSIKIGEINKIIRDLWTLTYKGEDISNIELVSGQESGSRATRSYNYRVVMTKGNTQLDMRGRCSAGQRVLASIVIRLALAETFCINCGCIALDEPTVNLDYKNKKGLAIALAQIVAARAQQSNFQLIMITHDEEFVGMMKGELSSQTGFPMPEKYFQVRREEGVDGKFYSKIDAVDWDELL